ncbi:hypothetical protein BASA81_008813 [Batrachochytrium salamandrivorans]|nr:hypothetical protein BASA81_008813 [Batrachochytrium salamandrivorans]
MLRKIRSFIKSKKQAPLDEDDAPKPPPPAATSTVSANKRLLRAFQAVKKKANPVKQQRLSLKPPPVPTVVAPPNKPPKPSIYRSTADQPSFTSPSLPNNKPKLGVKFAPTVDNKPVVPYVRSGSSASSVTTPTMASTATSLMAATKSAQKISALNNTRRSMGKMNFLGPHEQAFLPGDLLYRLGQSAGQLPPAPSVFSAQGAVLFVDVSGFTALAERLGKENVPVKASEKLAFTITRVLQVLAKVALDGGGEVGKFAGDALLCVWESDDLDKAENLAKHAAVEMLVQMEVLNRKEKVDLQIHGGVAKGSIVHFHFGSQDDDLRWYIISGEAAVSATTVVDVARAGEFCCQDEVAKGLPQLGEGKSRRGGGGGGLDDERKTLTRGKKELAFTILTAESKLAKPRIVDAKSTLAVLKDGLPRNCNVYIPVQLREQLNSRSVQKGEMRRKIAICFVEISSLKMTEDELVKHTVNDTKLDLLNNAFVNMTRIVHAFEGEVRDMLFDDKGCVYIGMWGAHIEEEDEVHPWNLLAVKAAMAICNEVPGARAGVSFGTCFVGFAGVLERRTDFVVVGHEVNMAARYMSNAKPGQVLVSSGVWNSTKHQIKYGPEQHVMVGKGKWAKDRSVYTPLDESSKRASFQASYRSSVSGSGLFVGRKPELDKVENTLTKITEGGKAGVILLEGELGRGKTVFLKRVQKMGKGKIRIVSGQALPGMDDYEAIRQVVESYTGIRPSMTRGEILDRVNKLQAGGKDKLDLDALGQVLPWANNSGNKTAASPARVSELLLSIVRLSLITSLERAALIVLDDVQWFDKSSLQMLSLFLDGLAQLKSVGLLLTFTVGSEADLGTNIDAIKQLRTKVGKFKNSALQITLPLLTKPEVKELAGKFIGAEPDDQGTDLLFATTKGDPSFLLFLVQYLEETKQVHNGVLQSTIEVTSGKLPNTCKDMIHLLLGELLSEPQVKVLQLAACAGGGMFDLEFVVAASQSALTEKQALDAMLAAADVDLVYSVVDTVADKKWRFSHVSLCQALRDPGLEKQLAPELRTAMAQRLKQ